MNLRVAVCLLITVYIVVFAFGCTSTHGPKTLHKKQWQGPVGPSITKFEFGPDAGDLWFGEYEGRVVTLTNPQAEIAGAFTYCGGQQTFHFRSPQGDAYSCPGRLWIGLAKSPVAPNQGFTGGVDWAFVVSKGIPLPKWLETFAKDNCSRNPHNVFLVAPPDIGAGNRILLVGPMRKQDGKWQPAFP